jgi:phosphoadenosine phosphosulfate reductase
MVADIDPDTPVVFCSPGFQFPESIVYRERIVDLLGLKNVSQGKGGETEVLPGDQDHYERMWLDSQDGQSRSYEIVHLNQTLAPYRSWISAVYHMPGPSHVTQRVDVEGRLIRVDPLIRWSKDEVRTFMREQELPFHPRATPRAPREPKDAQELPSYNY